MLFGSDNATSQTLDQLYRDPPPKVSVPCLVCRCISRQVQYLLKQSIIKYISFGWALRWEDLIEATCDKGLPKLSQTSEANDWHFGRTKFKVSRQNCFGGCLPNEFAYFVHFHSWRRRRRRWMSQHYFYLRSFLFFAPLDDLIFLTFSWLFFNCSYHLNSPNNSTIQLIGKENTHIHCKG